SSRMTSLLAGGGENGFGALDGRRVDHAAVQEERAAAESSGFASGRQDALRIRQLDLIDTEDLVRQRHLPWMHTALAHVTEAARLLGFTSKPRLIRYVRKRAVVHEATGLRAGQAQAEHAGMH